MEYILENNELQVKISAFGAEIQSVKNKITSKNYLWNGDKEFWGRKSPVLFPFVGSLKNKEYKFHDKIYSMGQHGFARDMEFEFLEKTENSIWFELKYNEETLNKYPFKFSLKIGYELKENNLNVIWKVQNLDNKKMYFSIGAHPAFLVPFEENTKREDYFIKFNTNKTLINTGLENGLANKNNSLNGTINLDENGYLKIDKELFKYDALIIENNQATEVSLCKPDKTEYIKLKFETPLFGIWSPYKDNCPFVCIEPWYGRCDAIEFNGTLEQREWQNELKENEIFNRNYTIEFKNV